MSVQPTLTFCNQSQDLPKDVAVYCLKDFWQIHLYHASCQLTIGSQDFEVTPGCLSLIPPGTPSRYRRTEVFPYYAAHFSCEKTLPTHGVVWQETDNANEVAHVFSTMARLVHAQPQRAQLYLWDLLLLVDPPLEESVVPTQVSRVIEWMSAHLHEQVSLAALAKRVNLSGVHLNRLFVSQTGKTAVAYFRDLKLKQVKHFLAHTDVPIKSVAADVGFYDLHAFNKWVKTYLGSSPTNVRKNA